MVLLKLLAAIGIVILAGILAATIVTAITGIYLVVRGCIEALSRKGSKEGRKR